MSMSYIMANPDISPGAKRRLEELYDKFKEAFEDGVTPVGTHMFNAYQILRGNTPVRYEIVFTYRDDLLNYYRAYSVDEIEYIRDVSILAGDFLKNEIKHFNLLRSEAIKATIEAMNKERRAANVW